MKLKKLVMSATTILLGSGLVLVGCTPVTGTDDTSGANAIVSKGAEYTSILASHDWQGTKVYDAAGNDLTTQNADFIGLAKYDKATNLYEFFDKETKATRGDEGTFFVSADGAKRILISATKNYQAVVDITNLTEDMFTYKRMGKDASGADVEVFVDHIPYTDSELTLTNGRDQYNTTTGEIDTERPGREILGTTLWNGTTVKDAKGNDLTVANQMFISLAKFDDKTNKYEFFNLETGASRGDYGFYDVIFGNKLRAHVSIGENKYGAVLEITELNKEKFTYKRMGKDADGKDVEVFVEHVPYTGSLTPAFTV